VRITLFGRDRETEVRRGTVLLALLALVSLALVSVLVATEDDQTAFDRVNTYRKTLALPALVTNVGLNSDARRWVENLANTGSLSHDRLALGDWTTVSENVGRGVSVEVIQKAFEDSPTHEHNLAGAYTHLGVAVAARGNLVWVVQRFATITTPPTTVIVIPKPVTTTVTLAPVLLCRKAGE
jgi:uncharacterized protein YkwD